MSEAAPHTVAEAWAALQAVRHLPSSAGSRRSAIESLLCNLPSRGYRDIQARLAWFDYAHEQGVPLTVDAERALRKTLRADVERMAEIVKKATAAARAPVSETGSVQSGQEPLRPPEPSPPVSAGATGIPAVAPATPDLRSPDPGSSTPAPDLVHPIRRTNAQKRSDVTALLDQGLADREVARRAGVSPQMVGNVRREMTP